MIGTDQSPAIGENTQFKKGRSGNPAGKPPGTKHLSTHIRDLLENKRLYKQILDGKAFKGAPIEAIIKMMITKAIQGDMKACEWLAKYGYGRTLDVNINDVPQFEGALVQFIGDDGTINEAPTGL